jgi:3-isopropylmalate dehydrogenase
MMLRYSLNLDAEANAIEDAVRTALSQGYRTVDIMSEGCSQLTCSEMGDKIASLL